MQRATHSIKQGTSSCLLENKAQAIIQCAYKNDEEKHNLQLNVILHEQKDITETRRTLMLYDFHVKYVLSYKSNIFSFPCSAVISPVDGTLQHKCLSSEIANVTE